MIALGILVGTGFKSSKACVAELSLVAARALTVRRLRFVFLAHPRLTLRP
jgi:hypothetical protein